VLYKYKALGKGVVRAEFDMRSASSGEIRTGETISVFERREFKTKSGLTWRVVRANLD
jgi:hypothetical protein